MISVITPVYNSETFIESCIKVVIDQGCPDVEHIIIDGGSTDRTVEIIKRHAEKHPHIRWISERDEGQSDALNKGIGMAMGKVLAILNVDDFYEPNVLNRVSGMFKSLPERSLLVGNCNVWNDKGNLLYVNKPRKLNLSDLLLGFNANPFPVNPSAYFYHTSLHEEVGPYKVEEHFVMDIDFLLRAVQVATVKYMDETWGNFRMDAGTKTSDSMIRGKCYRRVKSIMKGYRKNLPLSERWNVAIQYELHNNWFWRRVAYYLRRPHDIVPGIKIKLMNRHSNH